MRVHECVLVLALYSLRGRELSVQPADGAAAQQREDHDQRRCRMRPANYDRHAFVSMILCIFDKICISRTSTFAKGALKVRAVLVVQTLYPLTSRLDGVVVQPQLPSAPPFQALPHLQLLNTTSRAKGAPAPRPAPRPARCSTARSARSAR